MPLSKFLTVLLICLYWHTNIAAQCKPAVPAQPCNGTESLVTDNSTINLGTTKYYYGSATTLNSLTMNGGKLIVCGDLTIDKFYMDSGQIIVNPGARFVVGSGIGSGLDLKGNSSFYNYGTLEIQRNVSLQGGWASPTAPNIIHNVTGAAIFRMSNQYLVINNANSWFINNGYAQFWGIITDAQSVANSVCLGIRSVTHMATLINKVANTYNVSVGSACLYVHQFSQFYGQLTNTRALFACLASSHHNDASCVPFGCIANAWGQAQIFNNCANCAALQTLPTTFTSISFNDNILKWEVDADALPYEFYIEYSGDGQHFYTLDSVQGERRTKFSYTDRKHSLTTGYYRVRCKDIHTGQSFTSKIVISAMTVGGIKIYPSPFTEYFFITLPADEVLQKIIVTNMEGKMVPVAYRHEGNKWRVTPTIPLLRENLVIQIITNKGVYTEKIMH